MKFPNLNWAISNRGLAKFNLAHKLDQSEAWLSRRLNGHLDFAPDERKRIAMVLEYPVEWLFREPRPPRRSPARKEVTQAAP
jgi:hypothetical protein